MTSSSASPEPCVPVRWGAFLLGLLLITVAVAGGGCASGTTPAAGARLGADGSPNTSTMSKVTVAGDSISVGLGASLRSAVASGWEVKVIGEEGSGLARPDRFDWPTRLQQLAREFPPTVLVLSLGSNDASDLTDASGKVVVPFSDSAAWDAQYSQRLAAAFDAFAPTDTAVVWVGHVATADIRVARTNRHIHELATDVAASRSFVRIADLADLLGTGDLKATRCLIPDGLHVSVPCLDEAAGKLAPQLRGR